MARFKAWLNYKLYKLKLKYYYNAMVIDTAIILIVILAVSMVAMNGSK